MTERPQAVSCPSPTPGCSGSLARTCNQGERQPSGPRAAARRRAGTFACRGGRPGPALGARGPKTPLRRARQPKGSPLQGRKVTMSSAVTVVSMSDSGDMDAPKYKSPRPDATPPASIKPDADVAARFPRRGPRGAAPVAQRRRRAPRRQGATPPAAVPVTPTRRTTWRRKAAPSTYDDAPSRNVVHPVTPPAARPRRRRPPSSCRRRCFCPPSLLRKPTTTTGATSSTSTRPRSSDSYWFSHTRAPVLSGQ